MQNYQIWPWLNRKSLVIMLVALAVWALDFMPLRAQNQQQENQEYFSSTENPSDMNSVLPVLPNGSLQNTKSSAKGIFYWHLNAKYVNDFQNGDLTISMDDLYTYGIDLMFSLNNWDIFWSYRSLTDRYVSLTRIDEMEVTLRYTMGNLLSSSFWQDMPSAHNRRVEAMYSYAEPLYLGLILTSGYFQVGNILGQDIQNYLHELSGVPKVYLDYLEPFYSLHFGTELYFSYTFELKKLLPSWEDSRLELGAAARAEIAVGYQETLRAGVRSKLYSGNQYLQFDLYLQQLGYYNNFGRANTVESAWSDTKTALWLSFSSRSGLYQRQVDISFGSLSNPTGQLGYPFGFGSLELSWAYLQQQKRFVHPDYSHSLLISIGQENLLVLDRFAFFFQLADRIPSDLSIMAIRDLSADPRLFKGNSLARKIESIWLAMLNLRPTLKLGNFGFLELYAGVGAGITTMEFLNSIEQIGPRSSFQYFTLAGQTGLRWYGLALRRDGAVYGIEAALLAMLPFNDSDDSNMRFARTNLIISNLQPKLSFMVGITVLTDW